MSSRKRAKPKPRAEQDDGIDPKTEVDRSGTEVGKSSATTGLGPSEDRTQSTHPKLEDIKRAGLENDQERVRIPVAIPLTSPEDAVARLLNGFRFERHVAGMEEHGQEYPRLSRLHKLLVRAYPPRLLRRSPQIRP